MAKVLMVGSAEKACGGISSVIRLIKKMSVWQTYSIYWLGTQSQGSKFERLFYAVISALRIPFILWQYDIIHSHNVPGTGLYTQLPQLLFAKLYKKRFILEIHVGNQLEKHKNNKLFLWWLKKSDLVLFLSPMWERKFKEWYPDVRVQTDVLYNACDIKPEISRSEKKKSIIMAAYLNDNKAPDLLLKAWYKLKQKYPDWHVTIMGNGEVDRFKKMAEEMGLQDVSFPGYIDGIEKEKIWREASLYCMCSYQEGFPMVVIEAWNYGVNVVTTPVGGLPDVIEEGRNCLTFPFGDYNALAIQLDKLMCNEELRDNMAKYSRQYVVTNFSLERISNKLDSLYVKVLSNLGE